MIPEKINVRKDILKSNSNYANSTKFKKGELYFENRINNGLDNIILIIDLKDIIFNYYFARCFGSLFKLARESSCSFDIIFEIEAFQVSELLLGIVDYLELNYSSDKNGKIEDFFVNNDLHLKFLLEKKVITFFSKHDKNTVKVLEVINKKVESDFDELMGNGLTIPNVELYPILTDLLKKRFIYQNGDNKKYLSAYKYISKL